MRKTTGMVVLGLVLMLAAQQGQGVAPPEPSGTLTVEQQKQILTMLDRQQEAAEAGKMVEALQLARQIEELRQRLQAKRHWETMDARFKMQNYARLARLSDGDQKSVGESIRRDVQGRRLLAQGKVREAEPHLREALAIRKRVLGEKYPDTASSYNNLASCLNSQSKAAQALPLYEKALAISKRVLGEDHPDTANGYNGVAFCLYSQGKAAQALPLFEKSLAISKRVLGENHPSTANGYNNVAGCLNSQGEAAQALPLYEKALAIYRKVHGEQHPSTATSYNNVALCLNGQGKAAQALPLLEKALAISKRVHGEEHPDTAISYHSVASCLNSQSKAAQALPLYEKALAIYRKVHGEEHPSTANGYNSVAFCLYSQGKAAQALPLYEKALAIRKRVLGEEHSDTAIGYSGVAGCLNSQGEAAQALPLCEKALAIYRKVHGEQHPSTAIGYSGVAFCVNSQGKAAQALPLYEKALAIYRKVHGEQHPDTANGYNSVAVCLDSQGKVAQALPLYEKALAIRKRVLGEEHPDTASSYNNLASCVNSQGEAAQALPLYEKALAIFRKVHDEEHPDTATSYNNVATCLDSQGKAAQALPLYEKALAIRKRVLGEEHPSTANSYNGVAYCLNSQGKSREAIRRWEAALLGYDVGRLMRTSSGFQGAAFGANKLTPREGLALAHARLGERRLAWEHAEAALGRGLLEDLSPTAPDDRASIAELRRLDERLPGLVGIENPTDDQKTQREEVTRQRRTILTRLSKQAATRSAERVWSLERIQKQLPADTALMFWITTREENWACVVRSTGLPQWKRLEGSGTKGPGTAEDRAGPNRLHELLTRPDASPARRDRLLRSVEKQWFAPLRPHLAATVEHPVVKRLVVVPSRFMSALPVELLAPDLVVSYAPSGTIFAQLASRRRTLSADSMLALGDPVFPLPAPDRSTPPATGLFVSAVAPRSSADAAGVREGDVLLRYDEVTLKTFDDLSAAFQKRPQATLTLWRDGKEQTLAKASPVGVRLANQAPARPVAAWRERNAPVTRGESYARLPGTRVEVEALARLVGKGCRTLLGSDASEQTLDALARDGSLARFRVLHLATHGQVNLQRAEWSSLILSRDKLPTLAENLERVRQGKRPFTGELSVETILRDWRLDADLVVLSACQTGLGQETSGDGLLGFSHALLQKGARSVVLSRWQVADDATALLMLRFYENLLAPKARKDLKRPMPRAEALAEAKRWLRGLPREEAARLKAALGKGKLSGTARGSVVDLDVKEDTLKLPPGDKPYSHPYFWAAFVLIGDPD